MFSWLDNTIRWYIIVGAFLYIMLFAYYGEDCFRLYNALILYTFASYALILWNCNKSEIRYYTSRNLGITVLAYSTIYVILYLLISEYYVDNTFLFSEADAKAYFNYSMALSERPYEKWIPFLTSKGWDFDDWGTPITLALIWHIYQSKLFVNFCYIVMNTISAIQLFKIGENIMPSRYAYLASLSYAISSYSLFFMGSFLKEEILVFLVVTSYFMLYMYFQHGRVWYLIMGGIFSLTVLFFRPPIIIFIGMSYMMMLLLRTKNGALRSFVILMVVIVFIAAIGIIQYSADRYANGGDISESYQYVNTSTFQKIVLYAGALIGPFPSLLQVDDVITYKPLFGAGLLFKLMLAFAFWKGLWYVVKYKLTEALPLYVFVIVEMLGLSVALDGLELRKAMPHVPLFILVAFWCLSVCDRKLEEKDTVQLSHIWNKRQFVVSVLIVFGAVLVWNTMKT